MYIIMFIEMTVKIEGFIRAWYIKKAQLKKEIKKEINTSTGKLGNQIYLDELSTK